MYNSIGEMRSYIIERVYNIVESYYNFDNFKNYRVTVTKLLKDDVFIVEEDDIISRLFYLYTELIRLLKS